MTSGGPAALRNARLAVGDRASAAVPARTEVLHRVAAVDWLIMALAAMAAGLAVLWQEPVWFVLFTVSAAVVSLPLEWEVLVALMFAVGFFVSPMKIVSGGWLAYMLPDVLVTLVLLRWLAGKLQDHREVVGRCPVSVPFAVLGAYLLFEFLNPSAPVIRSLFGLRSWVLYTALLFAGYAGYRNLAQVARLYRLLIFVGTITAVYGILQWRQGPDAVIALGGGYRAYGRLMGPAASDVIAGGPVFRAPSTFMTAPMFGGNMAAITLVAVGILMSKASKPLGRILATAAAVTMAVSIVVSGSRGPVAYLGCGLFVATLVLTHRRIWLAAAPLAVVAIQAAQAVTAGAMSGRFSTMFDPATYFWKWYNPLLGSLRIAIDEPFGRGLGYTAGVPGFIVDPMLRGFPKNTVDSGYGAVAQELGIIGLLLFAWFAARLGVAGIRAWRALPHGVARDLFLAPAIWAVAFPVWTLLAQPHASVPASMYFWLLIGMLLRAGDVEAGPRRPAGTRRARRPFVRVAKRTPPASRLQRSF